MQKFDNTDLDGRLLKLFLAVYDTNSFSKAAGKFDLNQSTVSYSIDKLRTYFNDPLFVKAGRGVTPTEHATLLAPKIRSLVVDLESLSIPATYSPKNDTETMTIGVNSVSFTPNLINLYKRVAIAAPNMSLRIIEFGSRSKIETLLESREVDLIISVRGNHYPKSCLTKEIMKLDNACFYDPKTGKPPKTIDDYCEFPHAKIDYGANVKSFVDLALESACLERHVKVSAPNTSVLAQLVKGTEMIITMPSILHLSDFSDLAFVPSPIDIPEWHLDMIWHRRTEHSGRGKWMRNLLISTINDDFEDLPKSIKTTIC